MINTSTIFAPITQDLLEFEKVYSDFVRNNIGLSDDIVEYMHSRRGKRIRPTLVFLSAKLSGGITRRTMNAAVCTELMHNAALVHDDVVDQSFVRRNLPTFNAIWGDNAALLFGDYLMSVLFSECAENGEFELIRILSRAFRKMSRGELMQLKNIASADISEDVYFDIINSKTAMLISACCESAVISAGGTESQRHKMKRFGKYLGIAYQIRDDIFDYQPDSNTGKTGSRDIYEKKLTLPLIYALTKSDPADSRGIIDYLKNGRLDEKQVGIIIKFVDDNRGIEYARSVLFDYIHKALTILETFDDSEPRNSLIDLTKYLANRDH
jgi:octaprenyl-diphosphate synthase